MTEEEIFPTWLKEGHWGGQTGREWIPNVPKPTVLYPCSNPNFKDEPYDWFK